MIKTARGFVTGLAVASFLTTGFVAPAGAAMLGTETLVATERQQSSRESVNLFLARADVSAQLQAWGVAPEAAEQRVAAMTDAELAELAAVIDQQPAGAGALEVIGVVFLVLLILELVGVINVFSKV